MTHNRIKHSFKQIDKRQELLEDTLFLKTFLNRQSIISHLDGPVEDESNPFDSRVYQRACQELSREQQSSSQECFSNGLSAQDYSSVLMDE